MVIRAVIFDWGGTISRGNVLEGFLDKMEVHASLGREFLRGAYEKENKKYLLGKIGGREYWKNFSELSGIKKSPGFFQKKFLESSRADPKMLNLVRRVKMKCKVALLSDNFNEMEDFIEKEYRIKSLFNAIALSNREGVKKPSRKFFRIILERLGLKPDECIFIDDKIEYVNEARKMGITSIHFKGRPGLEKRLRDYGLI